MLIRVFVPVGYVTGNKWLDFSGDPDHERGSKFFNEISTITTRINCPNFADNSRSCRKILMMFLLRSGMSHYQQTIRFWCWSGFGNFSTEFLPVQLRGNCKNFTGPAGWRTFAVCECFYLTKLFNYFVSTKKLYCWCWFSVGYNVGLW